MMRPSESGARLRKYCSVAVALALFCLTALALPQATAEAAGSELKARRDTRVVVTLDTQAHAAMLAEMRMLLENVCMIIEPTARNDLKAVAAAARASGLKAASEAAESMEKKLPQSFVTLGMSMHKEFDAIAAQVEKGDDGKRILASVAETMKKCSACHAAHQLRSGTESSTQKR